VSDTLEVNIKKEQTVQYMRLPATSKRL